MAGYELPVTRVGLGGMDQLGVALGSTAATDYLGEFEHNHVFYTSLDFNYVKPCLDLVQL